MSKKTFISWSCGKDSASSRPILRQDPKVHRAGLVCTVIEAFERVTWGGGENQSV